MNVRRQPVFNIFALSICALATPAEAISRLNAGSASCESITSVINKEGAAIVRYQSKRVPGLSLFDRYVERLSACYSDDYLAKALIPAKDGDCRLSYCRRYEKSN